ncbi:MAG: hypothetical protein U0798_13680 [Gemmataceae bacterium]
MTVKKTSGKSRPATAQAKAVGTSQTAAERRSAEAELRKLITTYAPTHEAFILALRRWFRKRLPTVHEVVYEYRDFIVLSYSPNGNGYDGVIGIHAGEKGIKLFFNHAQDLPDPAKILEGSGKQTRSLPLAGMATMKRPEVVRLVDEALIRNRIPFEAEGRGSIMIRSTTASKKREARA